MGENAKHTPGPWRADVRLGVYVVTPASEFNNCLSGVSGIVRVSGIGEESSPNGYRYLTEEQIANARLIAAAPDLFRAAELAEEFITTESMGPTEMAFVLTKLRSAIAKARGEGHV